jgi:DNA-binding CsgD family transcriptional regulator
VRPPSDEPNLVAGRRRANDLDTGSVADSRRRLGGHSRARQFLVTELGNAAAAGGVWRGLVSALQRHAVENAIVELSPEDKEVLTLAYLQGQTNSQIAARLNVSSSTVRRRLSVALARLEARARRSGAWISSIATAAFLQIVEQVAKVGRVAGAIRPADWSTGLTGALTAGALVAVGVSLLVPDHHASTVERARAPAAVQIAGLPQAVGHPSKSPSASVPAGPSVAAVSRASTGANGTSATNAPDADKGCGGNPTNAPPVVPVGPRAHPPAGAPVTHPSAGGCTKA